MFFSYTASVILLSLAIYGAWCLVSDLWCSYWEPRYRSSPGCTFLVFVRNQEQVIEEVMRCFLSEIDSSEAVCDAVVIDCGSVDLTPMIIERLTADHPLITFVALRDNSRPSGDLLPLCQGGIIHVLDMTGRLKCSEFLLTVHSLLRH
mgnify:CR=1 FL=1